MKVDTKSVRVKLKEHQVKARAIARTTLETVVAGHWEQEASEMIRRDNHVYKSPHLFNNMATEITEDENGLRLSAYIPSTVQYGSVIHNNRRKGARMPPREAIAAWVERKLGIGRESKEFDGIVFCIRRSIKKNGLKSLPANGLQFYTVPLKRNIKQYLQWIAKRIAKGTAK